VIQTCLLYFDSIKMDTSGSFQQFPSNLATHGFDVKYPIHFASSPGRMDVLGGIADYSGSRVIQMPIESHTSAYVQRKWKSKKPGGGTITLTSISNAGRRTKRHAKIPMCTFFVNNRETLLKKYENLNSAFSQDNKWCAYIIGPILVCAKENNIQLSIKDNFVICITSSVPEGKGVSSSAAVEIASSMAFLSLLGLSLSTNKVRKHVPLYSFFAENTIVGVPCGMMDHLACFYGKLKHLTPFTCSLPPLMGKVQEFSEKNLRLWGIDSTVRHFNGGSNYAHVRAAAFMGRHIIMKESLLSRTLETLCSINRVYNSEQFNKLHEFIEMNLPEAITGNEFIEIYGYDHGDEITLPISRESVYYIRASVDLALREDVRVRKFEQILHRDLVQMDGYALGVLLRDSHTSYSRCSMGSPTTEILINLLDIPHIFGARISGGGCGGLVICLTNDSEEAEEVVKEAVKKFSALQNLGAGQVRLFKGSSDGANISELLFHFL